MGPPSDFLEVKGWEGEGEVVYIDQSDFYFLVVEYLIESEIWQEICFHLATVSVLKWQKKNGT